jgi:hypothetical protein
MSPKEYNALLKELAQPVEILPLLLSMDLLERDYWN